MHLKSGTLLQGGKYRIEKVLGQGGFGITYLAVQSGLNRKVAIKEFFMKEYCNRDAETSHVSVGSQGSREAVDRFKLKFIKEAQLIAALNHPNIIRIHDIFEENGTAYYIMEYQECGSLSDYLEARGALDEANLKDVRFLVNHNTDMIPLARSRNNNENSTMQMTVDKDGMGIRVNLDTENNTDARNLYSAIKRGDITGMSFMFSIDDEEWENLESDHPTRHIRKIGTVLEVSAVTFPAYESTEISARDKEALDSAKSLLESKRSQSLESDKDALELEKAKLKNKFF